MAHVSRTLSMGVHALSDADRLRMPGHDTRFAAGTLPPPDHVRAVRPRARFNVRAWLHALRRPSALSH